MSCSGVRERSKVLAMKEAGTAVSRLLFPQHCVCKNKLDPPSPIPTTATPLYPTHPES